MIKLRHQQPSLWHRGLAEDIEGLWEQWMRRWMSCWKTSNFWTRCTKPKENFIRRMEYDSTVAASMDSK